MEIEYDLADLLMSNLGRFNREKSSSLIICLLYIKTNDFFCIADEEFHLKLLKKV